MIPFLTNIRVDLPGLGQVRDACVGTHENIGRVKTALDKSPLGLREVDPPQRSLGKVVVRHECQAVETDLVNGVHRLQNTGHPLETLGNE